MMVTNTGTLLPVNYGPLTERQFAEEIGNALLRDLGGSRRATKTLMRWADVSERTARDWINGRTSPNGKNLIVLAGHSHSVLVTFLALSGHRSVIASLELEKIESILEVALGIVRAIEK